MPGYLTETTYADGRLAFAINLPLIKISRSFVSDQPLGTVSPTPSSKRCDPVTRGGHKVWQKLVPGLAWILARACNPWQP